MDCPNWPPPLPSLPLYPPCREPTPPPTSLPVEVKPIDSKTQEWWDERLAALCRRVSGGHTPKEAITYELTRNQRRKLLPVRFPTREDKLIWSVPLPEGSYPKDGLPIWERLYLDSKLPMLRCPPNALVFARQQIGKKLWKDTEGQEFVLYDPNSYEVDFSYENVHDPHLTTYYGGKEIRGFLLSLGDATEDGWGLCSLKKFNQYRKYLRRVHLSLVHTEMKKQEALKDEIHKIKEYKKTTDITMEALERKMMVEEIRAGIIAALKQQRINRINRILASIQEKETRLINLYKKRGEEREMQRQRGLILHAKRELKNKIANEIKRRKKIATLRRWHDVEERTRKLMKKQADDRARSKAEKVRTKWQNKIDNLRKMFDDEDEYLKLQSQVRAENIKIRTDNYERSWQKETERFQEIRKASLKKRALVKRMKEDKRMERAIMDAWFQNINRNDWDLATEVYRVKKSINSTVAELSTAEMEGPDRLSTIYMARNRIQREQKIPIQVSYALDALLETAIQEWANSRLDAIIDAVINQVKENGHNVMTEIRARFKDTGVLTTENYKASEPFGRVYKPDPKDDKKKKKDNQCEREGEEEEEEEEEGNQNSKSAVEQKEEEKLEKEIEKVTVDQGDVQQITTVVPNYVHYGPVTTHEYPIEYEPQNELKSCRTRPKTPMPSQEILCEVGFSEERLTDVLPTLSEDVMNLKEKHKFRSVFKSVAVEIFKRSIALTKHALEPVTRVRAINKLAQLQGVSSTTKTDVINTLCQLITNQDKNEMYQTEEFEWLVKVIAREAIKEVLNPPEFHREEDDRVARMKIMFYAPRQRRKNER